MNRTEYIEWTKQRALEYANDGDIYSAIACLVSDLNKHPKTKDHPAIKRAIALNIVGGLNTREEVIRFINDVN